ncbi:MAG: PKD domain-containing protein [Candidatus Omnitrophica bacterium]|nr:PKD domain-containing protein [Candidatus Omnitrophota bacterium]
MKNLKLLLVAILFLSGCAGYRYHHGQSPHDEGYVVSRDGYTILEYTLGPDDSVPDRYLAKERFKRRRRVVEDYYKKMGYIQNRFKEAVWGPWTSFWKLVGGIFRLPFIAIADYKYEHNPEYKKKVQEVDAQKEAKQEEHIEELKVDLDEYIQEDLSLEELQEPVVIEPGKKSLTDKVFGWWPWGRKSARDEAEVRKQLGIMDIKEELIEVEGLKVVVVEEKITEIEVEEPEEVIVEEKITEIEVVREDTSQQEIEELIFEVDLIKDREKKTPPKPSQSIEAVITARPLLGLSPLVVKFNGRKSRSPKAKIVSYDWNFGDGDTSNKSSPTNTFYSGSFEPKVFTVTLTVQDNQGKTDTSSVEITVKNK